MKSHEFAKLLDKYLKGKCTPSEKLLVDEWFGSIPSEKPAALTDKEVIEKKLWSRIKPGGQGSGKFFLLKIAASVIFLVVAGWAALFMVRNQSTSAAISSDQPAAGTNDAMSFVRNNQNTAQEIILEDGSFITLRPGSEVWFPKKFEAEKREIHLAGEAFFKVKRDTLRPFLVYSNEIVTKVLGTSFNIKAYASEKQITVAVRTGKVSVSTNSDSSGKDPQEVILTPNQQVVYDRKANSVSRQLVEHPDVVLSKPTVFTMQYDGAPVTGIFDALEENYGVDIRYDASMLEGCVLTTSMTDEDFYERIDVICKAINAEYTTEDGVIVISSRGCHR
jgi:transmembrane sensor